ncbi:hypothetical protein NQX30_04855 [Candidatus Persebacteraceae bacterium Df01]|jgi:hypothetical protein|uniref:Uncharacterized protein n=1 Tax=Candidatus Doriopsillibacter californiensis TaxID=2970740 RepID=A0ABT7QM87_9GAMM|nr:hypothetical protein [Candidatus Persebacteraceae bacterium Df01]
MNNFICSIENRPSEARCVQLSLPEHLAKQLVLYRRQMERPCTDLLFAKALDKTAAIIDIGGGNSNLVNFLLNDRYTNITVLIIKTNNKTERKKRGGKMWLVPYFLMPQKSTM